MRSGYVAAKSAQSWLPWTAPSSAARSEPTASSTARTSSICVSSVSVRGRSERPVPRLSKRIRRENDASRSREAGEERILPRVADVAEERHEYEVDGPVADHLVGDRDVAASCVLDLGRLHGEFHPCRSGSPPGGGVAPASRRLAGSPGFSSRSGSKRSRSGSRSPRIARATSLPQAKPRTLP